MIQVRGKQEIRQKNQGLRTRIPKNLPLQVELKTQREILKSKPRLMAAKLVRLQINVQLNI